MPVNTRFTTEESGVSACKVPGRGFEAITPESRAIAARNASAVYVTRVNASETLFLVIGSGVPDTEAPMAVTIPPRPVLMWPVTSKVRVCPAATVGVIQSVMFEISIAPSLTLVGLKPFETASAAITLVAVLGPWFVTASV